MIHVKQVYLNPKQLSLLSAHQKTRTWIGGRGSGKSVCIGGSTRQKCGDLPRAKGFFASSTYSQILTKTLPPITKIWESFGLREYIPGVQDGCYVKFKQPPKKWDKPYSRPEKFTNVITFWNGFTIELLSMDRPELSRGGSYDFGEIDEAAVIKQEVYGQVLVPSVRDNRMHFSHWSHHQISMYSSMPWKSEGMWLLDYQDRAKLNPEKYFYLESVSADNIHVLGAETLERWKDEMPHGLYNLEILNKRYGKSDHCFYYELGEKHLYHARWDYQESDNGYIPIGMVDTIPELMIEMSFDFGGWFSGFAMFQEVNNTEYMRDSFHVKQDQGITQLIDAFAHKYKSHKWKFIRIWGEPRGHNKQATGYTLYQEVESRLRSHGWAVDIAVAAERSDVHENRYELINQILSENDTLLPRLRINDETCKDVYIALQNTEVTPDFKKNKKNEKNRSYKQQHATHFPDLVDYFFMQKHGWKMHMYGSSIMGGSAIVS